MTRLLLCALLLLPSVAWATPFTSSVSLDLTTLTFTGIPVTHSLIIPRHDIPIDPLDPLRDQAEVEQRDVFLAGRVTPYTEVRDTRSSLTRSGVPITVQIPGAGAVTAISTPTELSSAVTLLTSGFGSSLSVQNSLLTAMETGPLTVTVDFTLAHSAPPIGDPDFGGGGRAALVIGRFEDPNQQRHFEDMFFGNRGSLLGRSGTLSATYFFQQGQSTLFEVFTTTHASVPEPDSLWLVGMGFVGLVGLGAWRQRGARLS